MEANAGESFQMQILFNIFPRISLHCKLVPVQYWEYEYGLLLNTANHVSIVQKVDNAIHRINHYPADKH